MARFRTIGHVEMTGPVGSVVVDTFTCIHCQAIVDLKVGESPAMCHRCWAPVCQPCHGVGTCTPFEKKCEQIERNTRSTDASDAFLRALGM